MIKLQPIAHSELFHYLSIISQIKGNSLTFRSYYDYRECWFSSCKHPLGQWTLHAGKKPTCYWQAPDSTKPRKIQSAVNWLSFGIDELLSYDAATINRAIAQWKIQLKKNRAWRINTQKPDAVKTLQLIEVCRQLYDISLLGHAWQQRIRNIDGSSSKHVRYSKILDEIWNQCGELLCRYHDQLVYTNNGIGHETDDLPILNCLVLSSADTTSTTTQGSPTRGENRIQPSDSYLLIQNTILRHIRLATQFRDWLKQIPAPARQFAVQQNYRGHRWFLINLWQHAPKSRSYLQSHPQLTYAIASTWTAPDEQDPFAYQKLDQLIRGKRSLLLIALGLPPTRRMRQLIKEHPEEQRQRIIDEKKGGISLRNSVFEDIRNEHLELLKQFPKSSPFESIPDNWKALMRVKDIYEETSQMHHCLYDYHLFDIAENTLLAFSVRGPANQRATLTIIKNRDAWEIDELVGKRNSKLEHKFRKNILNQAKHLLQATDPIQLNKRLSAQSNTQHTYSMNCRNHSSRSAQYLTRTLPDVQQDHERPIGDTFCPSL